MPSSAAVLGLLATYLTTTTTLGTDTAVVVRTRAVAAQAEAAAQTRGVVKRTCLVAGTVSAGTTTVTSVSPQAAAAVG